MWAWASYVPVRSGLFLGGEKMTEQEHTSGSEAKKTEETPPYLWLDEISLREELRKHGVTG